jgi:hypothetical protein
LALDAIFRRLTIQTLNAQIALHCLVQKYLAKELEAGNLTAEQRSEVHGRWQVAVRDEVTLRTILEQEERLLSPVHLDIAQ